MTRRDRCASIIWSVGGPANPSGSASNIQATRGSIQWLGGNSVHPTRACNHRRGCRADRRGVLAPTLAIVIRNDSGDEYERIIDYRLV